MELTLTTPDDWHLHLRDDEVLPLTVNHAANRFARAIIMPNLSLPIATTELALAYRDRILAALEPGRRFSPLMTLYLTDRTTPEELYRAADSGAVFACKLYPAGATTNSEAGITDPERLDAVFETMTQAGLALLVHGEVTDPEVDVFDREAVFIERTLQPIVERHPKLKIVLEHVTTRHGVDFVRAAGPRVGGTLTAHHLLYNRNEIFRGGLNPHLYCLPVLKREEHRRALVEAATRGDPSFFLGTDSAPHGKDRKESGCGCAGIYTAHAALELYATAFEQAGSLDRLEAFASHFGPDFYGLPRNTTTTTLVQRDWEIPQGYEYGNSTVVPLEAGKVLRWSVDSTGTAI